MGELIDAVDAVFTSRPRDEWGERLDKAGIVWGPVQSLDEVSRDPQASALGLFPQIEHAELGSYATVNAPMRFADCEVGPKGPAPTKGQHTAEILAELGLTEQDVDKLRDAGHIA